MDEEEIRIGISKLLHTGSWAGPELSEGPEIMERGGLGELLESMGCRVAESETARLTPEEEQHYGAWHRLGLASRHLGEIVAGQIRRGLFPIGLLSNCSGLMGMLAGLQRSGDSWRQLRVGLVWCDAHGDFNTPETTSSGMLGGMPVAVSTGLCLARLRMECGLDPPLPTRYVTMVGVRDLDPLERELLDRSDVEQISVDAVRRLSLSIDLEMERLAALTDLIYVHVDLDVLDPSEVPGHSLTVEDGPTSRELADALEMIFEHPKAAALGVAADPAGRDGD
ncbi:MAG: arginase family protein, partial [Candidatus Bathyarchaeia archaeon]